MSKVRFSVKEFNKILPFTFRKLLKIRIKMTAKIHKNILTLGSTIRKSKSVGAILLFSELRFFLKSELNT